MESVNVWLQAQQASFVDSPHANSLLKDTPSVQPRAQYAYKRAKYSGPYGIEVADAPTLCSKETQGANFGST